MATHSSSTGGVLSPLNRITRASRGGCSPCLSRKETTSRLGGRRRSRMKMLDTFISSFSGGAKFSSWCFLKKSYTRAYSASVRSWKGPGLSGSPEVTKPPLCTGQGKALPVDLLVSPRVRSSFFRTTTTTTRATMRPRLRTARAKAQHFQKRMPRSEFFPSRSMATQCLNAE